MDPEAEDAYNKRQNEPLLKPGFTNAKAMIPKEEIDARTKDYQCYNYKKRGCTIPKRERHLPYCAICYCLMSYGQEYFDRRKLLTTDEVFGMNDWQKEKMFKLDDSMDEWLKNTSRSATV